MLIVLFSPIEPHKIIPDLTQLAAIPHCAEFIALLLPVPVPVPVPVLLLLTSFVPKKLRNGECVGVVVVIAFYSHSFFLIFAVLANHFPLEDMYELI